MTRDLEEILNSWEWRRSLPFVLQNMRSVYGGFIGEKLSYNSPKEVWETLRKFGITQIIDLRYKYCSEKFKSRCKEYGISYYNYPVHNDPETIANMVENYSYFTELLCNGSFYMQGRRSSYVALSAYWTFSKCPGQYPYELRKEIREDAELMKKITPILHAMVTYKEERYGDEPWMSAEYFEAEKRQIKDFQENDGPQKVSFSVFDFIRAYRNERTVYDISVEGLGTVGYLYAPNAYGNLWEYDIIIRPSVSDKARSFEEAQVDIVRYLCEILPHTIKWVALPQSVKSCVFLLRAALENRGVPVL